MIAEPPGSVVVQVSDTFRAWVRALFTELAGRGRTQALEGHTDVRGLASRSSINFFDAIDPARVKFFQDKPCVDRGIQAHAKECS